MHAVVFSSSVVVTAETHNPSILHPEFLKRHSIIPDSPEWADADPPISTPAVSRLKFANSIEIICDPMRLQVISLRQGREPDFEVLVNIVNRYTSILQHTPYKAIGINFRLGVPCDTPDQLILDRFFTAGDWRRAVPSLKSASLRLLCPSENYKLRLSIDPGEFLRDLKHSTRAVLVEANFHRDLAEPDPVKSIRDHLADIPNLWQTFRMMLPSFA